MADFNGNAAPGMGGTGAEAGLFNELKSMQQNGDVILEPRRSAYAGGSHL